jgi:hypothetical protein
MLRIRVGRKTAGQRSAPAFNLGTMDLLAGRALMSFRQASGCGLKNGEKGDTGCRHFQLL